MFCIDLWGFFIGLLLFVYKFAKTGIPCFQYFLRLRDLPCFQYFLRLRDLLGTIIFLTLIFFLKKQHEKKAHEAQTRPTGMGPTPGHATQAGLLLEHSMSSVLITD
jgi:hypothetical protein